MTKDGRGGNVSPGVTYRHVAVGPAFPECYNAALGVGDIPCVAVGPAFPECYNSQVVSGEGRTVAVGPAFPECYNGAWAG